jgi:hypothetical protein
MDSQMLQMLKIKNPDKEYPSKLGVKWREDEEKQERKKVRTLLSIFSP